MSVSCTISEIQISKCNSPYSYDSFSTKRLIDASGEMLHKVTFWRFEMKKIEEKRNEICCNILGNRNANLLESANR